MVVLACFSLVFDVLVVSEVVLEKKKELTTTTHLGHLQYAPPGPLEVGALYF